MIRRPTRSTRSATLVPYLTLFRSRADPAGEAPGGARIALVAGRSRRAQAVRVDRFQANEAQLGEIFLVKDIIRAQGEFPPVVSITKGNPGPDQRVGRRAPPVVHIPIERTGMGEIAAHRHDIGIANFMFPFGASIGREGGRVLNPLSLYWQWIKIGS